MSIVLSIGAVRHRNALQELAKHNGANTGRKASVGPVKAPRVATCPLILHLHFTADILPYNFTDGELCENCKIV